jgi:hypothetical protein
MFAVEYWADHDAGSAPTFVIPGPAEALRILAYSGYGAHTRLFRAYTILTPRHAAVVHEFRRKLDVWESQASPQEGPGLEEGCALPVNPCVLHAATTSDPEADVYFEMKVRRPYTDVAKVLDPQAWDDLQGTSFQAVQRTMDSGCPQEETAPEPSTTLEIKKGEGWEGTLFEHFELDLPGLPHAISLKHTLCFDTEFHRTKPIYRVNYTVCKNLRYENWIWGGPKVKAGLEVDDGCTYADSSSQANVSKVGATKRLKLSTEQCGAAGCTEDIVAALGYGLKVLASETAIALSRLDGGESYPCETFDCLSPANPVDRTAFQCGMLKGFDQPWTCGIQ